MTSRIDDGPRAYVPRGGRPASWTFLTNHAHVLICLARDPDLRTSELAQQVGITERAVQRIVRDLVLSGYVSKERIGRRNRYAIASSLPLRHPIETNTTVGSLVQLVGG